MDYRVIYSEEELYHVGKKGMRWGLRRYQNPDGTWTELGKRRRRSGPSRDAKSRAAMKNEMKNLKSKSELDTARASYKVTKELNKQAVQAAKGGTKKAKESKLSKKEREKEEAIRSGDLKKIEKYKSQMTDDELRAAMTRMELNTRLSAAKTQQGLDTYKKFADVVSTTANLTKNGIDTYNNIAKIMNAFTSKDMPIIGEKKAAEKKESEHERREREARIRQLEAQADISELNRDRLKKEANKPNRPSNDDTPSSSDNDTSSTSRSSSSTSSTPLRGTVEGSGSSTRSRGESVAERYARERASAVDVDFTDVVENQIGPYLGLPSMDDIRRRNRGG